MQAAMGRRKSQNKLKKLRQSLDIAVRLDEETYDLNFYLRKSEELVTAADLFRHGPEPGSSNLKRAMF